MKDWEYRGHHLTIIPQIEDEGIKYEHEVTLPNGDTKYADITPRDRTTTTLELWIDAGYPDRITNGPLQREHLMTLLPKQPLEDHILIGNIIANAINRKVYLYKGHGINATISFSNKLHNIHATIMGTKLVLLFTACDFVKIDLTNPKSFNIIREKIREKYGHIWTDKDKKRIYPLKVCQHLWVAKDKGVIIRPEGENIEKDLLFL